MLKAESIIYLLDYIKHQLYLLEQPSESFKIWSAIIMKLAQGK